MTWGVKNRIWCYPGFGRARATAGTSWDAPGTSRDGRGDVPEGVGSDGGGENGEKLDFAIPSM